MMTERYKILEELGEYADIENTEWSEYINALLIIAEIPTSYGMSEELSKAIDKEVDLQLKYAKEHFTIVTETETYTRTFKSIEYND